MIRNPRARFIVLFLVILVGSFAMIAWNPVNDRLIVPYTSQIAKVAGTTLDWMGEQTTVTGTLITSTTFAVDVRNGCNGVEAMLILVAAILAFPAPWKARLAGVGVGTVIIQVLNLVRIDTLYLLGKYRPELFEIFHNAIWQVAIVLVAVATFFEWSRRIASTRSLEAPG